VNTTVEFLYDCPACGAERGPHRYDGDELACLSCGTPREVEPELVVAVLDMRFCDWCRATLPVGHDCPAGAVGCLTRGPADAACGACERCLAVQAADLAMRDFLACIDTSREAP
jgi:hypothetical protein